jgi:nucleoside-diphosphate-sugar epimerase
MDVGKLKNKYYGKLKLKKILVTGANGFVGRAVSKELVAKGFSVLCAVRSHFQLDGASIVNIAGLEEQADWSESLVGTDCVIHSAARAHIINETVSQTDDEYRKVNAIATLNLAKQAAECGVKRFIFLSTIKVNGEQTSPGKPFTEVAVPNPQDAYGRSKLEAEKGLLQIAEITGMEVVVIRPVLVYGPGVKANFASMLKVLNRGIPLPFGAVDNKRSFIYIGNLVSLIMQCIDHPAAANQVFLASDGFDVSTTDLMKICASALGVKVRLLPVPRGFLVFAAQLLGKQEVVQRLCGSLQVDINKAHQLLKWTPPFSFAESIKATATRQNF